MRLLAALLTLLAMKVAAQDAPLERLATLDAGRGFEGVGRLDVGGETFCTAALVSPDLIVTAAHCLYRGNDGLRADLPTVRFLAGWRDGRAAAYRGVRAAAVHPGFDPHAKRAQDMVPYDLALLRLDAPIRNARISPFEVASGPLAGAALGVVSYAVGRAEVPSLQRSCQLLARYGSVFVTSCEVEFGASGAPIFDFGTSPPRIVSVISAKARAGARPVALGADAAGALLELARHLGLTDGPLRHHSPAPRTVDAAGAKAMTGAKFLRP